MKNKFILIIAILAAFAFILFVMLPKPQNNLTEIKVKDTSVFVTLAKTPAERQRGLSGVKQLRTNEGMLFVFDQKAEQVFWMKDMYIALDMIWITDNKIVNITKNIPPPAAGSADSQLTLYPSNMPVDYVLEVNAGFSDTHQLQIGDSVDLSAALKR